MRRITSTSIFVLRYSWPFIRGVRASGIRRRTNPTNRPRASCGDTAEEVKSHHCSAGSGMQQRPSSTSTTITARKPAT